MYEIKSSNIIDLEQGSGEWLKFRKSHIGASEVASILETSPFSSKRDLWLLKTGRVEDKPFNAAMKHGQDLEPIARERIASEIGMLTLSNPVLEHKEYPFLCASLDGLTENEVIEIKCPKSPKLHLAVKASNIPDYYMAQVQFQMLHADRDKALFYSFYNDELCFMDVFRDDDFLKDAISKVKTFWEENILKDIEPEDKTPDIVFEPESEAAKLFELYFLHDTEQKRLDKKKADIRSRLEEISEGSKWIRCGGYNMKRVDRSGNIDYKSLIQKYGIKDEEFFRKPGSFYYKFSVGRDK